MSTPTIFARGNTLRLLKRQTLIFLAAFLIFGIGPWFIWPGVLGGALSTSFLPHAYCYLRQPGLVWTHVTADSLIGLAYVAISGTLAYLVYRAREDIPFHWMFLAFGLFIVACGGTHFMEVWTTFRAPVYWLAGYVKLITAVASVAT